MLSFPRSYSATASTRVSAKDRARNENQGDLFLCLVLPCRVRLRRSAHNIGPCKETNLRAARVFARQARSDRNYPRALWGLSRSRRSLPGSRNSQHDTNLMSTPTHCLPYRTDHIRWLGTSLPERLPSTRLRRC